MPLESLHALVESLNERIQGHGAALRESTMLTRYALIDPLLRELGWDTADPSQVMTRYYSGYMLLGSEGRPVMSVEAKSLGTSLRYTALIKEVEDCLKQRIAYLAITDGNCWDIYETNRPVPVEEKRVATFDISSEPTASVCLQMLALWRPSLESGHAVPGHAPLAHQESPTEQKAEAPKLVPPILDVGNWHSLSVLNPRRGVVSPVELQFPDKSHLPVKHWKDLVVEVTRWLIVNEYLHLGHYPIQRKTRYLVSLKPVHPSGSSFKKKFELSMIYMGMTVYIETNYSAPGHVENARIIIKHIGLDPEQFRVRFD